MDFIGRKEEIKFLEDQYRSEHPLVLVTGRRHVGKSTLIEKFIEGKPTLYFEVDRETSKAILRSFSAAVSKSVGRTLGEFGEWRDAISAYVELSDGVKKIIVLDEFQYISESDKDFTKNFQSIWDTYLSKKNVMIILCGSYLTMMRKAVSEYGSPLYGRNTGDLMLQPLEFVDTVRGKEYRRAVEEYSVTGGVPHYMALMNDAQTVLENIIRLTMDMGGPLLNEPAYLMTDEFRDPASYNTYLRTIAEGHRKADKITSAVQAPSSSVLPYLKKLIDVGMVTRKIPVTESSPEHSRNGLYVISDNFTALWFRFVYPYHNDISRRNSDEAVADLEEHFIDSRVSFVFEDISGTELRNHLKSTGVTAAYGSHWQKGLEIDVVAIDRKNKTVYAGECKYRTSPIGADVLHDLETKCKNVKEFDGFKIIHCIFSVSGYTEGLISEAKNKGTILFDCGKPLD